MDVVGCKHVVGHVALVNIYMSPLTALRFVAGDSILADTLKGDIYVGENLTAGNGIPVTEDGPDPGLVGMVTLTTGDGMLTVGKINETNTVSGNITAYGNVIIDTQKGDATVKTSVTSRAGSVSISSDNGNINVGEFQVANAISAKKDIDLHVADGTIKINGSTRTDEGDITVYARDEDKPDNIVITQNGKLDSARDLTLHSYNGGITVTKDTTAQRDLTVIVENEGNVKFAENVTVSGNIFAYAGKGDMTVGKDLTADKSIFVETGSGHVNVGAKVTAKTDSVVVKTGDGNVTVGEDITAGTMVELSSNAGDITVGDADGGNVKAKGNIDITTKAGDIEVIKTVISDDGNVKVTSDYGNVGIGSNGADVRTVYAKGDIDVHVTEGVIKVQGKTETATGNITMYAHNEKDAQNIVINQDGKLISGQDLTLHAYNGDIQVTDNTTAQRDLTVIIDNKGSVDFKKDVDVTGKVSATTKEGDIRIGETIDTGKEIVMTTGSGNIAVGEDVTSGRSVTLTSGTGYIDIGAKVTAKTDSVVVKTGSGDITVGEDVTAGTMVDLTTGTGHITVGNGSAGNVKGGGDVTVATGAGDVTINKTVASTDGSIDITSGKGKIHIGNNGNGPTDLTVHAKQNIALTAQDGVIEVFGKTKTDVGDITVLARDKDNTKNLLIDFNGELDAASTSDDPKATGNLKLQTYNGDIEISDRTKAKGDIYAKVENKGDISFGRDVDTQGSLTFEVDDGNVKVGKDLTAAKDITITSGKGDVVVGDTKTGDGGNVLSKTGDVSIQTGQGDVKIVKTVTAQEGSIDIATQEGNIHIGDNGPDVKTVTAKENVSLVTENGTIEVFGKTSTQNGDITLKAANPTYTAGPDGQNIIIDHNGQIASGQDATLIAKNGDLHVTDRVTAQRDVNAITRSKGDVFLDNDLKVNGSVTMQTDTGNINADRNVTAVNRIVAATGNGDITVGTANARYVALTSGGEDGNVQANAVHAQASGNANGTGAEDVKLGGSHVTVGTIVNDAYEGYQHRRTGCRRRVHRRYPVRVRRGGAGPVDRKGLAVYEGRYEPACQQSRGQRETPCG